MFLKIMGSVLLISACTGYGFSKGNEYKTHLQELEELMWIAEIFANETSYSKLPIGVLSARIVNKTRGPYRDWLISLSKALNEESEKRFAEIWNLEADKLLKKLLLKADEEEELKNLGIQLGNYNIKIQEQVFRGYVRRLEEQRNRLAIVNADKRRLCCSMGILTGIFLVIIFV